MQNLIKYHTFVIPDKKASLSFKWMIVVYTHNYFHIYPKDKLKLLNLNSPSKNKKINYYLA